MDSSDEGEPEQPVWRPRRTTLKSDDGDYKQNTEPEPLRRSNTAGQNVNLFVDAEAGVARGARNDKWFHDENDDHNGFIVADDIEF